MRMAKQLKVYAGTCRHAQVAPMIFGARRGNGVASIPTKDICDACGWLAHLTCWVESDGTGSWLCPDCVGDQRRALREGYEAPMP